MIDPAHCTYNGGFVDCRVCGVDRPCPQHDQTERHDMSIVLDAIAAERAQQDAKWGEQNHPDIGGMAGTAATYRALYDEMAWRCKHTNDLNVAAKTLGWDGILLEEIYEALAEADPNKLRAELIQAAAVCVAWVEAIDRRLTEPPLAA